jgi:hypothetical protein
MEIPAKRSVAVANRRQSQDAYKGLSGLGDPFAAYVSKGDLVAEAPRFDEEVRQIFAAYKLAPSNFRLGVEKYSLLKRAGAD